MSAAPSKRRSAGLSLAPEEIRPQCLDRERGGGRHSGGGSAAPSFAEVVINSSTPAQEIA